MSSPQEETRLDRADPTVLARDLLDGRQDAEDVAQDAWLLLHREPPGRVRSIAAWLKVAIFRLAVRSRRRDRRRAERERIAARPDQAPSVVEHLERKALQECLAALVDELGEPYGEVVRLRYFEDREIDEIARLVGRSPGTVRSQLKRGLDRLRIRMGEERSNRQFAILLAGLARSARARWPRMVRRAGALRAITAVTVLGVVVLRSVFALAPWSRPEQLLASAGTAQARDRSEPVAPGPTLPARTPVAPAAAPVTGDRPDQGAWVMSVEGDVLDPDGAPVQGAALLVGGEDGGDSRVVARSDERGRFVAPDLDGRRLLWAEDPGRIPSNRHFLGSKLPARRLELRVGSSADLRVGRVLSSEGGPVPAEILVSGFSTEPLGFVTGEQGTLELALPPTRVVVAADGRFRFGRPPQPRLRLLVTAPGHAPFATTVACAPGAAEELVIELPAPCALEGRLLRPDGAPAGGARLGLSFPHPLPERECVADEAGRFRFETLPPGPYALRLLEDPSGASDSCFVEGVLRAGERSLLEAVILGPQHTLRGRALAGDRPLAGWVVEIEIEDSVLFFKDERTSHTGADGSFAFPSCSSGSHVLRLFAPGKDGGGLHALAVDARAGEDEHLLHADATAALPGRLTGRLQSDDPRVLLFVSLKSNSLAGSVMLRVDPETGEFSADHLPAGTYQVRGWAPDVGLWRGGFVKILPGQENEYVRRVPTPGTLRVYVELHEGASWDGLGATIAVPALHDSVGTAGNRMLREDREQGMFEARLFPGEYVYQVSRGDNRYESRRVRIEPGVSTDDTISIENLVPMTLVIDFERKLRRNENATLLVQEGDRQRSIEAWVLVSRTERTKSIRLELASDTKALRVRTSLGLTGELELAEGDIVPGGTLHLFVAEPRPGPEGE